MRRPIVAALLAVAMLVSACGLQLPDQITLPSELSGGDPQTLEAATAAAQEVADRHTAKDFAGVWLMLTKQNRDGISQTDYVTLQNACDQGGLPAKVTGVRMEGTTKAIVRWNVDLPVLSGFKVTKTMFYENGKWALAPEPEFVPELGKPVQQIIEDLRAQGQGHCDKSSPTSATVTTASPTLPNPPIPRTNPGPYPPPPTDASTSDVSAIRVGGMVQLVAVRLGQRDGYDRLVFEFTDAVPTYTIGYRPLPAHADGSGDEIPLPGASAFVQVTLTGATGSGWGGGPRTYFGPSTLTADTVVVTEAKAAGDFEAVLNWVVGLRSEVAFRVSVLDGPPRLVIDFEH